MAAPLIAAFDLGTAQSVSNGPVSLTIPESTYIPGSFPVARFRRSSGVTPLNAIVAYFGGEPVEVNAFLLRADVDGLPDTLTTDNQLASYEIASGGNYTAASGGLPMPDLAVRSDTGQGVIELSAESGTYTSSDTNLTVTYRWVVLGVFVAGSGGGGGIGTT